MHGTSRRPSGRAGGAGRGGSQEEHTEARRLRPLTQSDIEDVLHGIPRLRVQDAPAHAEPDDGQLGDHAAQQDSQVAPAVVHQVQGARLVGIVHQPEEHHREDHKPAGQESQGKPWNIPQLLTLIFVWAPNPHQPSRGPATPIRIISSTPHYAMGFATPEGLWLPHALELFKAKSNGVWNNLVGAVPAHDRGSERDEV